MYIDPHILCTPSIADIDGDGHDELVVAVSYFFDREYYDNPVRALRNPLRNTALHLLNTSACADRSYSLIM